MLSPTIKLVLSVEQGNSCASSTEIKKYYFYLFQACKTELGMDEEEQNGGEKGRKERRGRKEEYKGGRRKG